jgi:AraC-like DNA-binding protein
MAYVRLQRLNEVRRQLASTDRRASRIVDVAGDCGFDHLGHFGVAYKSMFGSTPSETRLMVRYLDSRVGSAGL